MGRKGLFAQVRTLLKALEERGRAVVLDGESLRLLAAKGLGHPRPGGGLLLTEGDIGGLKEVLAALGEGRGDRGLASQTALGDKGAPPPRPVLLRPFGPSWEALSPLGGVVAPEASRVPGLLASFPVVVLVENLHALYRLSPKGLVAVSAQGEAPLPQEGLLVYRGDNRFPLPHALLRGARLLLAAYDTDPWGLKMAHDLARQPGLAFGGLAWPPKEARQALYRRHASKEVYRERFRRQMDRLAGWEPPEPYAHLLEEFLAWGVAVPQEAWE